MTPPLRDRCDSLGLSGRAFAGLTGVHPNTVQGWGQERSGRGVQAEPVWAWRLIDAWARCPEALEVVRRAMAGQVEAAE